MASQRSFCGTLGDLEVLPASEALKAVAAFRLALPRTMLRFAGGREITLGDLGAKKGILGGINAVIVGEKAGEGATCMVVGASAMGSCLRAAFLAAQEGVPLSQEHLIRAVQLEYREMGKLSSSGKLS